MTNNNSNIIELHDMNVQAICNQIYNEGILMRELSVEYRKNSQAVLTRSTGFSDLSLTQGFMDDIEQQLTALRSKVVLPLIKHTDSSFTISIEVNPKGQFSFDNMNIRFKIECAKEKSIEATFRTPFRVLMPFAEYIVRMSIQGNNFRVGVVEGDLNLSVEDLEEIIEQPIIGPRVKANWYSFASEAYEDAKKIFKLDIEVPCFEGEIEYTKPNKMVRLQHLEYCVGEGRRGV